MSNETKRNVFGQLLNAYQNLMMKGIEIPDGNYLENITTPWNVVYDAALPDDLPVIPEAIGEYITSCKARMMDLHDSMFNWLRSEEEDEFMDCHSEIFARAWLLGAWRIQETGEIVKLEEEK